MSPQNIQLTVSDTGIGISPENTTKIFSTFTQASSSTNRIYGGTGLGLSISKHLVALMGGEIGVRSFLGKGSDFWFTLPATQVMRNAPKRYPTSLHLKVTQKVLVVDPSPKMAKIIEEQLTAWGLSVVCCHSSKEAMIELDNALFCKKPFNLVILENQLLHEDSPLGIAIYKSKKFENLAMILLSRLSHRNQFHALHCPNLTFIMKPVPTGRLHEGICKVLKEKNVLGDLALTENKPKKEEIPQFSLNFTPRVLVVDDNIINQKIAATMLTKQGCQVDIEDTGKSAVNRVKNSVVPYDVIFMDIHLPGQMNGYEASSAIREYVKESGREEMSSMVIVALTASVTDEQTCTQSGMQGLILKPVRLQDFKSVLASIASKKQ